MFDPVMDVVWTVAFVVVVTRIAVSLNMLCRMDPDGPVRTWILDRFGWFRLWPRRVGRPSWDATSDGVDESADKP